MTESSLLESRSTKGISVVVPVFNGADYLDTCMNALLAQTLRPSQIILVDDGSADHSGSICDQYAMEYDWVQVIHQKNQGSGCSRNAGIRMCRYEWISFVDVDDIPEPDMLESLLSYAIETGSDCVCCDIIVEPFQGKEKRIILPCEGRLYQGEETIEKIIKPLLRFYRSNVDGLPSVCAKLFRKSVIENNGLKFSKRIHGEDWQFFLEYLHATDKVSFLHKALYHYIHHKPDSLVNSFRSDYFTSAVEARLLFEQLWPELDWESRANEKSYYPIEAMGYYRQHVHGEQLKELAENIRLYLLDHPEYLRSCCTEIQEIVQEDPDYFVHYLMKKTNLNYIKYSVIQSVRRCLGLH